MVLITHKERVVAVEDVFFLSFVPCTKFLLLIILCTKIKWAWLGCSSIASKEMEAIPEYKIILLGEPGVGKTNFFFRLMNGVFIGNTASTVSTGIEHMEYKMKINGSYIKVTMNSGR